MMRRIFLCLYMCSNFLFVISWKVTTDYCKIKCKEGPGKGAENTACTCKLIAPREEIFDDLVAFRKAMVDTHNELRDKIASGKQDGYPSAANMLAISYDMELEYIARCYARRYDYGHDKCRDTLTSEAVGQNIAGHPFDADVRETKKVAGLVRKWYEEYKYVSGDKEQFIKHFNSQSFIPHEQIAHFTGVVWWSLTLMGCARVNNPKPFAPDWRNALICDYGGAKSFWNASNLDNSSVYKIGPPCSACPYGTSCSKQYKSLCGKIEPIPEDEPTEPSGGSTIHKHKSLVFVCVLRFLLSLFENLR